MCRIQLWRVLPRAVCHCGRGSQRLRRNQRAHMFETGTSAFGPIVRKYCISKLQEHSRLHKQEDGLPFMTTYLFFRLEKQEHKHMNSFLY
jgi:hypothetical protein